MMSNLLAILFALLTAANAVQVPLEEPLSLGGCLILVNRTYTLPVDYQPYDLVMPDVKRISDSVLMRSEAAQALEALFRDAKKDGYTLIAVSGYRSYGTQRALFNRKIKNMGGSRQKAQRLVAPPGASEHQTGLAMDVRSNHYSNLSSGFARTKEGIWLAENCCKYGFIIRYKAEWEEITGYAFEPWHIRYVGKEHARLITELDIPFETYITMLQDLSESMLWKE